MKENMDKLMCYQAAYNPDPFEINNEVRQVYGELLKEFLPEKESKKTNKISGIIPGLISKITKGE
ncbi:hypothetical protein M1437_02735 [Patescibacteria group bacterium]|nr:hypothetical protein [Patescibacteria group bacterium]